MSMAGSYVGFDPYQQWLGIPPHEQPPHLYRLLSLQAFEPDLQTIAMASDRLLGYLGTVSDPAYAPIATRVYEEILTARATLTDPYRIMPAGVLGAARLNGFDVQSFALGTGGTPVVLYSLTRRRR